MANQQKEVERILKNLLKILDLKVDVSINEDKDKRIGVVISGDNLGNLIGFKGETLNALQLFLEIATFRKLGQWVSVSLDINGYRKEKEDQLKITARKYCDKVKFFANPIELSPMSSYERMIVHTVVSEYDNLESYSEGEGRLRHVIIRPKQI